MTLSPKLGVAEISTLWHFRLPLPIQMFIKVVSSPILSGIGMPSPILWSHPLKMQRIVLLSSLLWWELRTNPLITGPGEWLSFRRFTSKLSWSWSWARHLQYVSVRKTTLFTAYILLQKFYCPIRSKNVMDDGWVSPFQKYFSHIGTMEHARLFALKCRLGSIRISENNFSPVLR